ncbi:uncharacterized mitochondrial protein AtMg00810-like [Carya illinoinensis]|uniref:uncharacterized mitochondrial protein AtMg00810-like n=1 Tax=Carya illinoinensis TaxID=32201 RepID=UPI001C71DCE6|nr:uncharacterized mitochondrial protein AtMg00810-like [Carya illinoinensis]
MEPNLKLKRDEGDIFNDPTLYRQLVGKLLYLTHTRPNFTHNVHLLSQFMETPRIPNYNAILKVLRYLKGTPGQGLFFPVDSQLNLTAYLDASLVDCPDTRLSTTRFYVFIGKSLVSWKSKKQTTVSRSSAESEYRSIASVVCKLTWLRYLLSDLHVNISGPGTLFCDNLTPHSYSCESHFS